jgi:hypothetical protein
VAGAELGTNSSSNIPTTAPPAKRTRADIQRHAAEKKAAKVKDVASQVAQLEESEQAGIKAVAAIEDAVRQEQWEQQLHAERPDIPTFASYQPPPHADMPIPMDTDKPGSESEGGLDIPVDTDSDGLGLGSEHVDEDPSDGSDYQPPPADEEADRDSDDLGDDPEQLKAAYRKMKAALAQTKKDQVSDLLVVQPVALIADSPHVAGQGCAASFCQ